MPRFKKKKEEPTNKKGGKMVKTDGTSGAIYGMGVIGAAVYYIIHATSFWMGILGIIKALFWPAFIMFKVLEMLKM